MDLLQGTMPTFNDRSVAGVGAESTNWFSPGRGVVFNSDTLPETTREVLRRSIRRWRSGWSLRRTTGSLSSAVPKRDAQP